MEIKIPPIEERMRSLVELAAKEIRPCRACSAMLYFIFHPKTGKVAPYTIDGVNHWITCPRREELRKAMRK
jgi:hypothetical protein